jgi:HK97 gp10 family phage protein
MGATVEISGYEEILRRAKELGFKALQAEKRAVKRGGEIVADTMRKEVPVSDIDHLHIRDDIKISGVKMKGGTPSVEVGPGKETAWRAKFLEFGTIKMSPNPFISRSAKLSREQVKIAISSELRKGLGL